MSQELKYQISCPKCSNELDVTLFESINVESDPSLRDALMENKLNGVTCPACDFSFRVDKPLLYCDPTRKLFIYWLPTADNLYDTGTESFQETVAKMSGLVPDSVAMPEIHLVFTRTEMVERIFLNEAGLDERVIEYIKYLIFTKNLDQLVPAEKALLFNAEDSTDESLVFVVQDVETRKLESVITYSRSAYQAFCEMFDQDDQTAILLEMFPGPYISARALLIQESEVPDHEGLLP
jgi:hypothetical protein